MSDVDRDVAGRSQARFEHVLVISGVFQRGDVLGVLTIFDCIHDDLFSIIRHHVDAEVFQVSKGSSILFMLERECLEVASVFFERNVDLFHHFE